MSVDGTGGSLPLSPTNNKALGKTLLQEDASVDGTGGSLPLATNKKAPGKKRKAAVGREGEGEGCDAGMSGPAKKQKTIK